MQLSQAKVLITGGSSGIGAATARQLTEAGAQVVIASRSADKLKAVADEVGCQYVVMDVTDEQSIVTGVRNVIDHLGGLNVLINNAGYGYISPLVELEADKLRAQLETNVVGATIVARECARHFVEADYGNIINIGSTSALNGSARASAYAATKFGLRGMTMSWRNELRRHNVRVMLVNPSEVMTSFADNRVDGNDLAKVYTAAEQRSKLTSDEVAHTIKSLLAMDDRGFITEATIFATNPET